MALVTFCELVPLVLSWNQFRPFLSHPAFENTGNLWGWEDGSLSETHVSQYVEFGEQKREEPV